MPIRINKAQLTRKYWPAWRAAEKALIATGTYDKADAEELRKEITGGSSKDLTNRQLDECLRKFYAISQPSNGKAQADQADQPLKRVRFVIGQIQSRLGLPDSYIEGMAVNIARCSLAFCNEDQLKAVLKALKIHENRHNQSVAS
jgi:hypothetical protein